METLYKILLNETVGWDEIDEFNTSKLTKEQCQVRLEELIAQGYNPNHLRAVPDA